MSKTGEGWGDSHEQTFRTKGELAYDLVKARVLDGSLVPGSVVNQAALAQQIGMSTTPLREGLRRLSAEGLIRLDAHRDATIAPLSAEEARHIIEMRTELDPLGVALAAERYTPADATTIKSALEDLRASVDDTEEGMRVHRLFHVAIYEASHNPILIDVLNSLRTRSGRYRIFGSSADVAPPSLAEQQTEHDALAKLVLERDAAAASTLMRSHVKESLAGLALRFLEDQESPATR